MEKIVCENCHHWNEKSASFCMGCGAALKSKEPLKQRWIDHPLAQGLPPDPNANMQLSRGFNPAAVVNAQMTERGTVSPSEQDGVRVHAKVERKEQGDWYCPDCGEWNANGRVCCRGCGRFC